MSWRCRPFVFSELAAVTNHHNPTVIKEVSYLTFLQIKRLARSLTRSKLRWQQSWSPGVPKGETSPHRPPVFPSSGPLPPIFSQQCFISKSLSLFIIYLYLYVSLIAVYVIMLPFLTPLLSLHCVLWLLPSCVPPIRTLVITLGPPG